MKYLNSIEKLYRLFIKKKAFVIEDRLFKGHYGASLAFLFQETYNKIYISITEVECMLIREEIIKLKQEVIENRRALHQIPEIGLNTIKTCAYLIEKAKEYGVDHFDERFIENSVVMLIKANHETTKAIGLRSDMDALPMREETGLDFASLNSGCMHACGHDGHMATMLATIHYLCNHRDALKQNVTIIFQPGEESPGGAEVMIKNGLFKKYPVDRIIGMHVMSDQPSGTIGCCAGPMMARNGEFQFTIKGRSAHGATPHEGRDAVVAGASLVMNLQTIVARNVDPIDTAVITVGKFNAGQVRNVIADHAELIGTMRSFSDENYFMMKERMGKIADSIATMYDVDVHLEIADFYGVVRNDAEMVEQLKEVCGDDFIQVKPRMISEDFSFYQQEVPGIFYFCGVKDETHTRLIHDSAFNFNEEALLNGVETNIRMLEKLEVL